MRIWAVSQGFNHGLSTFPHKVPGFPVKYPVFPSKVHEFPYTVTAFPRKFAVFTAISQYLYRDLPPLAQNQPLFT